MENKIHLSEQIIARVLRWGSGISIVLMVLGLTLLLAGKGTSPIHYKSGFAGLFQILGRSVALDPMAVMTLGVLVLVLTPLFRVVGACFSFLLLEKDTKYALISFGVLVILIASFFVPGFK